VQPALNESACSNIHLLACVSAVFQLIQSIRSY